MVIETVFVDPCPYEPRKKPAARAAEEPSKVDFKAIKATVLDFGAQALSRKDRLRKEEERLVALGCAPRKKQKVPRKIASAIHKAHVERDKADKAKVKETGVVLPLSKKSSKRDDKKNKRRMVERGPDTPGVGIFKGGMLRLNPRDPFGERKQR